MSLTQAHLESMCLPQRFWNSKLDLVSDKKNELGVSPKSSIESYLNNFEKLYSLGAGLLFWGNNGMGKTSAMSILAMNIRAKGKTVLFYESSSLKTDKIENREFRMGITVWERALSVDVLCLDDLGKGTQDSTGFGARLLDELLRYRYSRLRPTFITTNMPPSELKSELKTSTLSTLKECLLPIKVEGRDFREARKEDLLNIILKG